MIHFDIVGLENNLKELESKTLKPDFWEDSKNSNKVLEKIKNIKGKCTKFQELTDEINNILEIIDLLKYEYDEDLANEMVQNIRKIKKYVEKFEIEILLSGKYDKNNAILTIHPGARWNRSTRLG